MKFKRTGRIFTALMVLTLLLTGCSSQKLQQDPPNTGGTDETPIEQIAQTDENGNNAAEGDGSSNAEGPSEPGTAVGQNDEGADTEEIEDAPIKVKALYLTGWTVGGTDRLNHYVEVANTTEINSYVVDIKDDDGYVGYESQVPEVQDHGTWMKKYNVDKVIETFHDNDIYVIGRLVVFKDPLYSVKRPDLAIKNKKGGLWKADGMAWLNPYNKENWDYTISIAKEAVEKGFDEIQFDYVRFPGGGGSTMDFTGIEQERYEAINEFLAYAREQITEVPISADVFGIILESPKDTENIGQYLELIGKDIDCISPMVYPSHYALGQVVNKVKFDTPDLDPYGVVYNSLVKCRDRIALADGYKAGVRPYLQDFTASWLKSKDGKIKYYQEYEAEQVREQIKAVYDAGYEEWILWDARNTYHEDAFLPEDEA